MLDNKTRSQIAFDNYKYFGVDLSEFYLKAGKSISEKLIERFGKNKQYVVVCGLGGNAGDGLATAYHLVQEEVESVLVYLIGRRSQIEDEFSGEIFDLLYEQRDRPNLFLKQDCYARGIKQGDITIEALVGTGLEGTVLNKRYKDVIKRISHFDSPIVAVDVPAPHYTPDFVFSISYPKSEQADIIAVDIPAEIETLCGPGEVNALWKPHRKSHKGKNGAVFHFSSCDRHTKIFTAVSDTYAVEMKHFYFSPELSLDEKKVISSVSAQELERDVQESDVLLVDDIEENLITFATMKYVIHTYSSKPFIFCGTSIQSLDLETVTFPEQSVLIIPRSELHHLFDEKVSNTLLEGRLRRFCIEHEVNIVLVGSQTLLYSSTGEFKKHRSENIYDQEYIYRLAGLIAAYSSKNDIWLSMRAGIVSA